MGNSPKAAAFTGPWAWGERNAELHHRKFQAPDARDREPVIAWVLAFIAGPVLLGGYGWYLCRGPRRRRVSDEEIAQLEAIADVERDEDMF
jgi:hypothetical protein